MKKVYAVAGIVVIIYLALGFLSRRERIRVPCSVILRPFYAIAQYLYKRVCVYRASFLTSVQVEKDLERMNPGGKKVQLVTDYYVGKLAKSLLICLAGTFLGVLVSIQSQSSHFLKDEKSIQRGSYGEETVDVEIETSLPLGVREFSVEVAAKVYTEKEINALYAAFWETLPDLILGENASLQEITTDLSLKESYEDYPFWVTWESANPELIRSDGSVSDTDKMQEVELTVCVGYEEWEWKEIVTVCVLPTVISEEERTYRQLEKLLIDSERSSRTEEIWVLPDVWEGQKLQWKEKRKDLGPLLWMGAIAVAFLIYLLADKDLHDDVEKRRQQMKRSYPDIVYKLVLYLGAGMTIRGTLYRLSEEYEQANSAGKEQLPIYEELLHTCRELKAGVSEGVAYENFGKRTGLQEYIRLSTLLTQNLKKGNSALLHRLREEALKASEERIQYGKRMGEEAVTKLLLPMVMMLLVVMVIIMIPAFSSVGL